MSLKSMRRALLKDLRDEKNVMLFQLAAERHPVLANHSTPMSAFALLNLESPRLWAEKDAVVSALIIEQRKREDSFWNTFLCIAFYPMLSRLRHRILGFALSRDDLDQIVLSSFMEVVSTYPLHDRPDRVCMRLRQTTQRAVFRKLRLDQEAQNRILSTKLWQLERLEEELVILEDPEVLAHKQHLEWPPTKPANDQTRNLKEESELIAFLTDHAGDEIDQDRLDLLIATQIKGQRLSDVVRHRYPDLSNGDRQKVYQRVKRRHSRALAKLRELLVDLRCPQTAPSGALPLRSE